LCTIEYIKTGTRNKREEDLGWYINGLVKVDKKANTKGYIELSDLERGPIAASLNDYKTNNNSGKSDDKGKREDSDTRSYRRVVLYNLKIKRYII
jgi:hypothetical protein